MATSSFPLIVHNTMLLSLNFHHISHLVVFVKVFIANKVLVVLAGLYCWADSSDLCPAH